MDDMISRRAVIDAVHTATYGFICGAEDGDEMTDADKLVLSINKAVCGAIKALPNIPNTFNALSALDCIERQATIDALCDNCDTVDAVCAHYPCKRYLSIENLPSVQTYMSGNMSGTHKSLDCISRQAAIKWVKTECNPYGKPTLDFESGKKVIEHLEQMPSAEPESRREWYMKGYRDAQQRWIPVSEALPDELGDIVVISTKGGKVREATYVLCSDEQAFVTKDCWYCHGEVVAWMPLPEPWREQE